MDSVRPYSAFAIWLHWIVAALIVANVALALYVDAAPEDWVRPIVDTHKSIGLTVLGLAVLRLSWRLSHPAPPLPKTYPRWQRRLAQIVHGALYLIVFALPLTGLAHDSAWKAAPQTPLRWFGLFDVPRIASLMNLSPERKEAAHVALGEVHAAAGYVLYALVALHVAGALKHQWLDRAPELQRMGFSRKRPAR